MTELGILPVLLACAGLFLPAQALPSGPGARPLIDDLDRVTVPGSIHPRLAALPPSGPAAPDLPMARMILALKLAPDARARLDQLLRDQQDPASPRYHQWLTPDAFGRQFGTPRAELDAATGWLAGQGFTVASVARSGLAITFSGTAVQVGKAFRTTIVDYDLDGVKRHGNATPISLPRGLAAFADGVVSLNDLGRRSLARKAGPLAWNRGTPRPESARPQVAMASGGNAVGPGDFAAIYGLAPCSRPAPPAPASPSGWWDGATWRPVTGPPSPTPSGRVSFRPGTPAASRWSTTEPIPASPAPTRSSRPTPTPSGPPPPPPGRPSTSWSRPPPTPPTAPTSPPSTSWTTCWRRS